MARSPRGLRESYEHWSTSRPHIDPAELERAGAFWIDNYTARASLVPEFQGWLYFGIVLLDGDLAGIEHCLTLPATSSRRRFGLILQHEQLVGPCTLYRYRVNIERTVWVFAEKQADGTLWHELAGLEEFVPEIGDPDPDPE